MTLPQPKPGTGLNTIAFDLDGTLAEPTWPEPYIGGPIAKAVEALREYSRRGFEIIIYTSRPASHAFKIKSWLIRNELDALVYDVVTGKPRAAMYVDDRAVTFPEAFDVKARLMRWPVHLRGSVLDPGVHEYSSDGCDSDVARLACVPA